MATTTKEKAARHDAGRPKRIIVSNEPTGAQNNGQAENSSNGSNGQHEREESVFKIEHYGKGQRYTRILNRTLRHRKLCRKPHPMVVIGYALSKGRTYQVRSSELRKEFGWGEQATRTVMRDLVEDGFALLLEERDEHGHIRGRRWVIRESPSIRWPAKFGATETRVAGALARPRHNTNKDHKTKHLIRRGKTSESSGPIFEERIFEEGYKDKGKPKDIPSQLQEQTAVRLAHVAANLRAAWGERPINQHLKWPQYALWCKSMNGRPTDKGFWTWLSKQKSCWRNRVRSDADEAGFVLDGNLRRFYPAAEANMMAAGDTGLINRFQRSVRRNGKVTLEQSTYAKAEAQHRPPPGQPQVGRAGPKR